MRQIYEIIFNFVHFFRKNIKISILKGLLKLFSLPFTIKKILLHVEKKKNTIK